MNLQKQKPVSFSFQCPLPQAGPGIRGAPWSHPGSSHPPPPPPGSLGTSLVLCVIFWLWWKILVNMFFFLSKVLASYRQGQVLCAYQSFFVNYNAPSLPSQNAIHSTCCHGAEGWEWQPCAACHPASRSSPSCGAQDHQGALPAPWCPPGQTASPGTWVLTEDTKMQLLGNFRAFLPSTQLSWGFRHRISYGTFKISISIAKTKFETLLPHISVFGCIFVFYH